MIKELSLPITKQDIAKLKAGDQVLLTGTIYTARDAAHKRMVADMKRLPINIKDQVIYYCGPTPAMPGRPIGSAGPTTSSRMDGFVEPLLKAGLIGMIGKGKRSPEVRALIKKYKAIYFVATGGAGALLAKHIKSARVACYPDLGPEAIYELKVVRFPLIVANDSKGNDIFESAIKKYRRKIK
jgi:fumarate hydratase subunit beta